MICKSLRTVPDPWAAFSQRQQLFWYLLMSVIYLLLKNHISAVAAVGTSCLQDHPQDHTSLNICSWTFSWASPNLFKSLPWAGPCLDSVDRLSSLEAGWCVEVHSMRECCGRKGSAFCFIQVWSHWMRFTHIMEGNLLYPKSTNFTC